jgi:GTP-binding protein
MAFDFSKVEFLKTAMKPDHYPKQPLPEIAVVGRSNVGKSSLLNFLFNRKSLVKTSGVPGKTRAVQFFSVDEKLMVVDLPGYGYAKVPTHEKGKWADILDSYFEHREHLKLVLFLLDIRHSPSKEDRLLAEWAGHQELPLLPVFTKADKIKRGQRKNQATKILNALEIDAPYVITSATERLGRNELITQIEGRL